MIYSPRQISLYTVLAPKRNISESELKHPSYNSQQWMTTIMILANSNSTSIPKITDNYKVDKCLRIMIQSSTKHTVLQLLQSCIFEKEQDAISSNWLTVIYLTGPVYIVPLYFLEIAWINVLHYTGFQQ